MTGIELLQRVAEQVEEINKKVDVLDRNVKMLLNQRQESKITVVDSPAIIQTATKNKEDDLFKFKSSGVVKREKTAKVFGYIKQKGGIPIENVEVTIWNNKDVEKLKTVSNKQGYWEGRIPIGKYIVEYKKNGFNAINKNFFIDDNIQQFEVI